MKEMILAAARELFFKDGFEHVSMRNIAAKIEYSPAAIYRYFRDKEDIVLQLRHEGIRKLFEMQSANNDPDPFVRLRNRGRIYLEFAINEPEYYDLLFNMSPPSSCPPEKWFENSSEGFMRFRENVRECVESGELGQVELDTVVATLWSTVHGLAALASSGRLKSNLPSLNMDTLFEDVLDFIMIPAKTRKQQEV